MNLNQVTIPSADLSRSVAFYQQLGLKLIVDALPHYARFECPAGNSTFSLHRVPQVSQAAGMYVYFECEDLDERVSQLKSKGIHFDQDPADQQWLWREARLKDPDGHQLVLYFAGTNRLNPPWRLP